MKDFKKLCKAAAIIEIIFGLIGHASAIYFLAAISLGIILLYTASKTEAEILENKSKITILTIISFILNPIAGIIMIIACGNINDYEKMVNSINAPPSEKIVIKKKKVDPEIKKIDILLKLGVGMVFVSGILFATTSWDFINDLTKAIALIVLGTLFIGLSRFSENKLKLYYTTYMYWFLGISFYLLTVVGMLYFGIVGNSLTYTGTCSNLAYAITFFTVAGLALATYLKFSQKLYLYVIYTAVLLMFINLLLGLNVPTIIITLMITIASLIINIITKEENSLFKFNTLLSFSVIAYIYTIITESSSILFLITCAAIIVNISYLSIIKKQEPLSLVSLGLSYYLIIMSIMNLKIDINIEAITIVALSMAYTLFIKFKIINTNKSFEIINYIAYSCISLVMSYMTTSINPVIICAIYLAANYAIKSTLLNTESLKIARFIEPFAIFMLIYHFYSYVQSTTMLVFSTVCVFATLVYTFARIVTRDNLTKKIYNIASLACILTYFAATSQDYDKFPAMAIIIPCIYYFIASIKENKSKGIQIILYILALYSIYNPLYILDIFDFGKVISAIIFIWILALVIYLIKDEHINKTSYFILALPIYNIIEAVNTNEILSAIMSSILVLYITFLITKFLCKDEKGKEIVGIFGMIIAVYVVMIAPNNLISGLYIGILGIITTIIGYYRKNSKGLFITGIIITIINIIYQLKEFWGQVPFWLYLLVGGLGIIFFVTYREVKKINKK